MRVSFAACAVLPLAVLASSCEHANPVGPSALTSTGALVSALQAQGATVRTGEMLPNALPCLSVTGQVVFVNSGTVNAFAYPTAAAADRDASKVPPDASGTTGDGCASRITWVAPPHFYKRDQVIVVYAGLAEDVLDPLENVLGTPFAGRQ
jgi:hypothetical protein